MAPAKNKIPDKELQSLSFDIKVVENISDENQMQALKAALR